MSVAVGMPTGEFTRRPAETPWLIGQRAEVVRKQDNLKMEGDFQRPPTSTWQRGERSVAVKRQDNLKVEGGFDQRATSKGGKRAGFGRLERRWRVARKWTT